MRQTTIGVPMGLGILVIAIGLMFTACGGSKVTPESVEEYAEIACTWPKPDSQTRGTWGDFQSVVHKHVRKLENIEPPAVVRDYHFSTLVFFKAMLPIIKSQDKNSQFNRYDLWT